LFLKIYINRQLQSLYKRQIGVHLIISPTQWCLNSSKLIKYANVLSLSYFFFYMIYKL